MKGGNETMTFRTMDEMWGYCILGLATDALFSAAVAILTLYA